MREVRGGLRTQERWTMSSGGRDSGLACQCLGQGPAQQGHYINICGRQSAKVTQPCPHWSQSQSVLSSPQRQGDQYLSSVSALQSVDSAAFWKIRSFPGHSRINSA